MLSFIKKSLIAIVLGLIFIPAVVAQPAGSSQDKPNEDAVTEQKFKTRIFDVKYREPGSLANVLRQLGSGFKGSGIVSNAEFKTLTVRDFPENIATMEEALKRLDTPAPPRPNIELHMHILIGSNGSVASPAGEVPAELKDVITQLRKTLAYKNYELFTSVLQRLTETPRSVSGGGAAQIPGMQTNRPTQYDYMIGAVSVIPSQSGAPGIQIQEFAFKLVGEGISGRVQTALNLKDGEKVVVGTATITDRALIVVLIPKLIN